MTLKLSNMAKLPITLYFGMEIRELYRMETTHSESYHDFQKGDAEQGAAAGGCSLESLKK